MMQNCRLEVFAIFFFCRFATVSALTAIGFGLQILTFVEKSSNLSFKMDSSITNPVI